MKAVLLVMAMFQTGGATVPPNAQLSFAASTSPGAPTSGSYVDEEDTYAYTQGYGDGSYLILTGPRPHLTLNRRVGNVDEGQVDTENGNPGFVLTVSTANSLVYTCQAFPVKDGHWGTGPLTITITWP